MTGNLRTGIRHQAALVGNMLEIPAARQENEPKDGKMQLFPAVPQNNERTDGNRQSFPAASEHTPPVKTGGKHTNEYNLTSVATLCYFSRVAAKTALFVTTLS